MVFIKSWTEYQAKAEQLYEEQPIRTRYCIKYRAADGVLILKVTDDNTCLKYKTRSSIMLNRFEAFNLSIMSKMQNRQAQTAPSASGGAAGTSSGQDVPMSDATAQATGGGVAAQGGAQGAGGNKKKKPKKKK
ncbi:SubName: Full=Related to signal recognition particle 9 protein (SRP9) {ECO:0000313/EMBL:CCA69248.1} [Serendipita indica DSM 11827]|uniref:Related to signal recognition particle 9 protein (SRP9) n=1 Tax=Serendipita indica (strain DSM 11827) TaxID=1109443 RepID=G4TD62_SERID|nr:SubName: Full=Related to signal recognition particle 9 protein (SRP9) {ECO:0000313/EMBL:CCA69248.1} [Serendipita indica DSM 11827]CCA69248.1 related to signal recognition particle 9 protein (SRP9) [Serendipita indica DSM 11827]